MADRFEKLRRKLMAPEKIEALTGVEHSELKKKREELQRIDDKIQQLEDSGDEESLEFWKKRRAMLAGE